MEGAVGMLGRVGVTPPTCSVALPGVLLGGALLSSTAGAGAAHAADAGAAPRFKRLAQLQFIAADVDPTDAARRAATSGTGAQAWGIWRKDPGPRGVPLRRFGPDLERAGGVARAGWTYDPSEFWLEEHGIIMEKPEPLPPGRFVVTGGRETTAMLTVAEDGAWSLSNGASLYDVTHLPCRSAKYVPTTPGVSPASADAGTFPVKPGGAMPPVDGTTKKDYAVLFIVAVEETQ